MKITQTIAFEVPTDAIGDSIGDVVATTTITLSWELATELAEGLDKALNRVTYNRAGALLFPKQQSTSEFMDEWEGIPADLQPEPEVEETPESLSAAQILARMEIQAAALERVEPNPGTHDGRNPGTGIGSGEMQRPQRRGAS